MARLQVKLSIEVTNPSNGNVIVADSVVYQAETEVLKRLPMAQAVQEMVNVMLQGEQEA